MEFHHQLAAAMCARVLDRWGRVDVLVNNAGIAGPTAPVASYPPDAWHQVIAVNLIGVFHCTRACLPPMTAAGYGRIVNVASIAGKDGNPEMSACSASKAGVIAFTKSVAKEVARTGVLVNCVVPGVIDADLTDRAPEEERRLFLSRIPMGRWASRRNSRSSCPGWRPSAARSAPAPRSTCPAAGRCPEA